MTFKEKIKSILHPSGGHKKSTSSSTGSKSPPSSAAPSALKPDPNKPPNARDPGFRKSFNLGEPPATNGVNVAPTEPKDVNSPHRSGAQDVPVTSKEKMYTLDKYGEDYLAVSPRTNATVPDSAGANRGLSTVSPLEQESKSALGTINEHKRKNHDDPVSGAAAALGVLPAVKQDPNFGRDQFASGDRKDSGFVEPVPTRDPTYNVNSPDVKPEHPTSFDLESTPVSLAQDPSAQPTPLSQPVTVDPLDANPTSLLSPPIIPPDDTASSVYSDDSSRPPLQQVSSSVYSQPTTPPALNASVPLVAANHQHHYTSLVSDVLPSAEPPKPVIDENTDLSTVIRSSLGDSATAGAISPPALPIDETNAWSQGLIADLGNVKVKTPEPLSAQMAHNQDIPDTAVTQTSTEENERSGIDSNIPKVPDMLPPSRKPIITTTNTVPHADAAHMGDLPEILVSEKSPLFTTSQAEESTTEKPVLAKPQNLERPPLVTDDSVYAVTKDIPGAF
ncbi:hypothetical protein H072_607 [Dactylellina haptotyla CBS 200.50]|uniref:Altered inheritance of mitochondria protein 21 n=1 Tax=Dactylellina haptotyla (strain CBS 200.50) TaxID=1284197 RepID=S8CCM7_DACHA|nr:hypothetical protein H072_607 [Dactylellina haptotyla CBS 200.50]